VLVNIYDVDPPIPPLQRIIYRRCTLIIFLKNYWKRLGEGLIPVSLSVVLLICEMFKQEKRMLVKAILDGSGGTSLEWRRVPFCQFGQ
jgi:hypothetical protein